ncbi:GNAT family N-acetyltransferase [Paenibacillus sp. N1-5-1-14]|uniref:GNAT family N-acetyltransferase n=1 Tax=Paenibacillus radicibacter TaxID=2972488 RepID=UPI002159AA05|nr:GNAT family N-acetyltransferase [Paenibacillus radicibacter]MCR8644484.1 GNAT family N-acetyltransferase [Paenibacillus radicibacter]
MEIILQKSGLEDATLIHEMQIKAFMPLLEKYQDYETSPANETIEHVIHRMNQDFTDYYMIKCDEVPIGAVRIVKRASQSYRVSPIFILAEYQGKGIAQQVFNQIEEIYYDAKMWGLGTILQEKRNCYLYEKLGYKQVGEMKEINDRMTMVFYQKEGSRKIT